MVNYWILALKEYNKGHNKWCVAKKGTPENAEVRKIMDKLKKEANETPKKIEKNDRNDQVKKGNKIPIVKEPHTMYKSSNDVHPNRNTKYSGTTVGNELEKKQWFAKKFPNIDYVNRNGKEKNGTTFKVGAFQYYTEIGNYPNEKEKMEQYYIYHKTKHFLKIIKWDGTNETKQIIENKSGKNIKIGKGLREEDGEVIHLGNEVIYAYELNETRDFTKSGEQMRGGYSFKEETQQKTGKKTYYYDDWWSFTLEQRNKHRQDTIKKYEKELNEIKNKIRKTTPSGKLSAVDRTRKWTINFIMGVGLTDFKDEDEEARNIPKYPRRYWATVDDKEYFYKDEKELLLTIAENFGAFNY